MRKFQKIAAIMLMTAVVFAVGCTPEENKDSDVKVTTYTPQDITDTILFLASEQARMLTGQVIKVSGGHAL